MPLAQGVWEDRGIVGGWIERCGLRQGARSSATRWWSFLVEPEGVLFGVGGGGGGRALLDEKRRRSGLFPDVGFFGCELCGLFVEPSGLSPSEHPFAALCLLEGVEGELSASAGQSHQSAALLKCGA